MAAQMNKFKGLLGITRMDILSNARSAEVGRKRVDEGEEDGE